MILSVPKESHPHETRVAASPETVKKLIGLGFSVKVEKGAGLKARINDADYESAGATLCPDFASVIADATVLVKVRPPSEAECLALPKGLVLVGSLEPYQQTETLRKLMAQGVSAFTMEWVPRISRAQAMDVLSSQANLAGYKAVIDAASVFEKAMPMMMTAAGTIAPAKVLVLGAGVAGLQAIATARRLGAVVSGTDVRPAAREQVESLGATFVMVESEETKEAETAAGYAKEMSKEYQEKQKALVAETVKKQDILICTALIPGRKAPILITKEMVHSMRPGSIIVDLAVEQGGNCELSVAGEVVDVNGVRILGHHNWPGRLPTDASALYARNMFQFISLMVDSKTGGFSVPWDDEIIQGAGLLKDGVAVNPRLKELGFGTD